ncbi:MAG TPA: hypothetical protein VM142_01630 [Acidimicrobiales bacterium]|nr:hypothetical protein [Acidimicrobiales bacterium]
MAATYFSDPDDEEQVFARLEAARQRRNTASSAAHPRVAARVTMNHDAYPWMSGGANLSLAKAGHGPDSPVTKTAAIGAAKAKAKKGGFSIGNVVKAGARGVAGAVDFVVPEAVENAVGTGVRAAGRGAKPVVRGTFLAFDALADEVAYNFRDTAQKIREEGVVKGLLTGGGPRMPGEKAQSDLAIIGEKLDKGERIDTGSGFFPSGDIAKEQAARAREFGTIDGHAINPGRLLASTITEPGTKPYKVLSGLVDAAIAIKADPAAVVLAASSKARKAEKLFGPEHEAAGAVDGTRKTTIAPAVQTWLNGKEGREVTDYLATEKNFQRAWENTNKKIPVQTLTKLIDADTPAEVRAILAPELGLAIREKPTVGGFGVAVKKNLSGVRMAQFMPGPHIDLDDLDESVEMLDRFQRTARLDAERIATNNERMARAKGRAGAFKVLTDTMADVAAKVADEAGGGPDAARKAREMTKLFVNQEATLTRYFVDEIGQNARVPGGVIDGVGQPVASPHLFVEYINRTIPLPDVRDIRRATSRIGRIMANPGIDIPSAMVDSFMSNAWRPLALLRGAWTVRVLFEEMGRQAAAGLDSMVNHPLSAIAWATGRKGSLTMKGSTFADDAAAAADLDDYSRALNKGSAGWRDKPGTVATRYRTLYQRGEARYARSWAEELAQLASDPLGRRVALGRLSDGDRTPNPAPGLDGIKDWWFEGAGREIREQMAESNPALLNRLDADEYVESVAYRVRVKTHGAPELVDAIATGKIGEKALTDGRSVSKEAVEYLRRLESEGIGPNIVKGDVTVAVGGKLDQAREQRERAIEWMFGILMAKPSNWLSRSPAFKQAYWNRAEELLPNMTPAAQQKALQAARKAKLDTDQISALQRAAKAGSGKLEIDDADLLAKGYGLDFVKKLLYDQTEKRQWADISRNIFPFGSAWAEVGGRWARLGYERPQNIRRAQQVVEGARGAGIFYTDPQTKEERFAFPGSQFVSSALIGVPIPLEGSVAGLSFFGSNFMMPGFGPMVQVPAGWLIPEKPEWDDVREWMLPYGEKDTSGGWLESFLPPWFQKVRTALEDPESDRVLGNATQDMARYLASTGRYDLSTVEGQADLLEDAKDKGKGIFLLRAFAQFFAPSPPTPKMLAMDKDGRITTAFKLTEEFHKLQTADYDTAAEKFLERFGEDAALFMVDKTKGQFPSSAEGDKWARANPELAKNYPTTYGFFAPQGGEFDYAAYRRQIRTGERKVTKPSEAIDAANAQVGAMLYRQAKDKMPAKPNAAQRQWLAEVRDEIAKEYPGYDPFPRDLGKIPRLIRELETIVGDRAVAATDAGQGVALYLKARAKALEAAKGLELVHFNKAKRARHLRDWLREIAHDIAEEHPDFAEIYERVFEREMTDDAEEAELVAAGH